ncbi:MAG: hypothetical protein ABIQ97_04645 [Lysobacteraceae bacterium]
MIVTPRFVFLHLHKSGGTFVNRFIEQFFTEATRVGYHLPIAQLPEQFRGLPVLGTVRNPWDYYVSWHAFQSQKPRRNVFYRVASENGKLGFNDTIRNLVMLSDQPHRLEEIRRELPDAFQAHGINLTKRCLDPLAGSGSGFYQFLYQRMFGVAPVNTTLLRMDRLRDTLPGFLRQLGVEPNAAMLDWIAQTPALNASTHAHYSTYYDADLAKLIARRDAEVIDRHGFRFEGADDS